MYVMSTPAKEEFFVFGKRIRQLRMNRKITQQQMADKLCISLNGYQKYEQGERFPSEDTLIRIADILNTSIDYLLGRDEFLASLGVSVDALQ